MAQNLGLHMPCFLSLSPPCYTRFLPVPKWFIGFQFIIDMSIAYTIHHELYARARESNIRDEKTFKLV